MPMLVEDVLYAHHNSTRLRYHVGGMYGWTDQLKTFARRTEHDKSSACKEQSRRRQQRKCVDCMCLSWWVSYHVVIKAVLLLHAPPHMPNNQMTLSICRFHPHRLSCGLLTCLYLCPGQCGLHFNFMFSCWHCSRVWIQNPGMQHSTKGSQRLHVSITHVPRSHRASIL